MLIGLHEYAGCSVPLLFVLGLKRVFRGVTHLISILFAYLLFMIGDNPIFVSIFKPNKVLI